MIMEILNKGPEHMNLLEKGLALAIALWPFTILIIFYFLGAWIYFSVARFFYGRAVRYTARQWQKGLDD